jgi:NTE family protein
VLDGMGEALDARSKLSNDYEFYDRLRKLGQEAAQRFLDAHFDDVGVRGTIGESRQLEREVA